MPLKIPGVAPHGMYAYQWGVMASSTKFYAKSSGKMNPSQAMMMVNTGPSAKVTFGRYQINGVWRGCLRLKENEVLQAGEFVNVEKYVVGRGPQSNYYFNLLAERRALLQENLPAMKKRVRGKKICLRSPN